MQSGPAATTMIFDDHAPTDAGGFRAPLVDTLPPDSRRRLLAAATLAPLAARQVLYRRGDRIDRLVLPLSGLVSLVVVTADGAEVDVALVGAEGAIGLPILLGGRSMHVDALVQVPGEGLNLPAATALALVQDDPVLRDALFRALHAALLDVETTAACNRVHSLQQRLARWLLMCHDRVREDGFPMTHEALARMLGVRRAGVTVAAEMLQERGAIRYRRGHVVIADRALLQSLACDCHLQQRIGLARL